MKPIVFLLLFSLNLWAQDSSRFQYRDVVEAYYDNQNTMPLHIYDSVNGKIVDTLVPINTENTWYKIAIIESDYGWFKIKNISKLPNDPKNYGYDNHWVKASGFLITVDNYDENHRVYLYDEPFKTANKIHKVDNFQLVNVIETSDLWAKVNFMVGKKNIMGWLPFKDQCAYPWTTCPK